MDFTQYKHPPTDCEHEDCDHAAKAEYGNRFCGVHKADYYQDQVESLDATIAALEARHKTALLQYGVNAEREREGKTSAATLFLYMVGTHVLALTVGAVLAYAVLR